MLRVSAQVRVPQRPRSAVPEPDQGVEAVRAVPPRDDGVPRRPLHAHPHRHRDASQLVLSPGTGVDGRHQEEQEERQRLRRGLVTRRQVMGEKSSTIHNSTLSD